MLAETAIDETGRQKNPLTRFGYIAPSANKTDANKAVSELKKSLVSQSLEQVIEKNKFYVEKTTIDGRDIVLCSCVPKEASRIIGVTGVNVEGFSSIHDVRSIYKKIASTRPYVEVDDKKKSIYIFQGLDPNAFYTQNEIEFLEGRGDIALGYTEHGFSSYLIALNAQNPKTELAHELAHTFHVNDGKQPNSAMLFKEGDAVLAEYQSFPNLFDASWLGIQAVAMKSEADAELIKLLILEEAVKELKDGYKAQDYHLLSAYGFILALWVCNKYGYESWDAMVKKMSKGQSSYLGFLKGDPLTFKDGKTLTFNECCEFIGKGLRFHTS
ncbi:hypothetical protein IT418_03870 [bacterium]|nr:hypothetical protein [bacterium]